MNKVELDNGEVQTDADGNFSVRVVLTAPETTGRDMLEHRYYVYEVQAEVTDGAAETQTNTLSLPVGKQSLGLQIADCRVWSCVRNRKRCSLWH